METKPLVILSAGGTGGHVPVVLLRTFNALGRPFSTDEEVMFAKIFLMQ